MARKKKADETPFGMTATVATDTASVIGEPTEDPRTSLRLAVAILRPIAEGKHPNNEVVGLAARTLPRLERIIEIL